MVELATVLPLPLYRVLDWPMNTGANGGYNFWSGIGSGSPLLVAFAAWCHHHNCNVKGCPMLSVHKPTAAGDFACRWHHPEHKLTHAQIIARHLEATGVTPA